MMIDVWIAVCMLLGLTLIGCFLWGYYREKHFSAVTSKLARGISSLPKAMEQVDKAFVSLGEQLSDFCEAEGKHRDEYVEQIRSNRQLVLDIERRLSDLIRDLKNDHSRTNVYNTNAHGGQTNQGQNVRGDHS